MIIIMINLILCCEEDREYRFHKNTPSNTETCNNSDWNKIEQPFTMRKQKSTSTTKRRDLENWQGKDTWTKKTKWSCVVKIGHFY